MLLPHCIQMTVESFLRIFIKIAQEVFTLAVFIPFAVFFMFRS